MVITVDNQKGYSQNQPVFNATWISAYAEEDEYFWFGSYCKLSVDDVVIISSSRVYRKSVFTLWLFDAVLTGQSRLEGMKANFKILDFCLKHIRNEALPPKPKSVDDYVLDNMYSFCQSKTRISLNLQNLSRADRNLQKTVCFGDNGLVFSSNIPKDNTNIFRHDVLKLFPNLVKMELSVFSHYKVNLVSLLSVLAGSAIPPSFKELKIVDAGYPKWLEETFMSIPNLKRQFAAKNWQIKSDGNWIYINSMK